MSEEDVAPEAEEVQPAPEHKKRAPRKKPEPVAEVVENSVSVEPEPVAPVVPSVSFVQAPTAVVGNGDRDPVYISKIVYKNQSARKSLSTHHLQRRLNELGYSEAYADADGWYGDLTAHAVAKFQEDHDLNVSGRVDRGTLSLIFADDPNVDLHLA